MPTNPDDPDLNDFLEECGWAPSTLNNARSVLRRWEAWLAGQHPPVTVVAAGRHELRSYLAEREQAAVGPATRHKDWDIVGAFYAWAARPISGQVGRRGKVLAGAGILDANPMLRVPEPLVPKTPNVRRASEADVATLIDHFATTARQRRGGGERDRALRNAAMMALMFRGGLRVGELPWIDLAHLVRDANSNIVACRVGGDDGGHAKSNKTRLAPVIDEAPKLLERYLRLRGAAPGPLFLGREAHTVDPDRRLTVGACRLVVSRAAKACGVVISSHDMRRGWTVVNRTRGVSDAAIQAAAGWSSSQTMRRYCGPADEEIAVAAFHTAADANRAAPRRLRTVS